MASEHDHFGGHLPIDPDLAPTDSLRLGGGGGSAAGRPARTGRARGPVLLAIAFGAALGASARYGVGQVIHVATGTFPWATFVTNVSGSLLLGLVMAFVLERFPPSRYLRPFIATGFLGSYTTYSTFAVECDLLIKRGHAAVGVAYAGTSLVTGFVAVWVGIWVARSFPIQRRGGT